MASNSQPRLLATCGGDGLVLEQAALDWLSEQRGPLAVLAVAGPARSGKSSLLNALFLNGEQGTFSVGETVVSCTRGIWARLLPPMEAAGPAILLLDTEGLGAPEGEAPHRDPQLFALAALLSSVLMYNSMGVVDDEDGPSVPRSMSTTSASSGP